MHRMNRRLTHGTLRDWRAEDAVSLAHFANNRKIWLNLRDAFPHPYGLADARRFLAMVAAQDPVTFFALEIEGAAAGGIGISLHRDIERLSAELGYWIAEPYWGRGIATEAIRAITEHALEQHGLVRVWAVPFASNVASCRALEKAGYVCEGQLRRSAIKDGVIQDQRLYAFVFG